MKTGASTTHPSAAAIVRLTDTAAADTGADADTVSQVQREIGRAHV